MGLIFHDLIKFDDAYKIINENMEKLSDSEIINLSEAYNRISAEDIYSKNNLPLYSRSQVDGYAVISSDIKDASYNNPVKLLLSGETFIGETPVNHPGSGKCIKVPTGGAIPIGSDAMVPFEDTNINGNTVIFYKSVPKFNEISNAGIDVIKGEKILNKYTMLDSRHIAVLAATGLDKIKVLRKINIGIISTGNELIYPGDNYIDGKIYDSNAMAIESELNSLNNFNVKNYGILSDDYELIKNAIDKSVNNNDITITIGSTSAGDKDMVYKILGEYTPGILFHGVRVKPGKPFIFAKSGKKIIFGLPGFPVSSMMILYSLIIPNIFSIFNYNYNYNKINAYTKENFELHVGNTDLLLIKLLKKDKKYYAYQVHGNSGSISRIMRANGFSIINSTSEYLKKNTEIKVNIFNNNIPDILIYGQYSPLIEDMPYNIRLKSIFIESGYNDIIRSMENNEADLYILNYKNNPENKNYDIIKIGTPYGFVYSKRNYDTAAILYKGSGLYDYSYDKLNTKNIIYLDNPNIIADYVKNKRCDVGITYKNYAEYYNLNFDFIDNIYF
ncbi:molybdopterin molybdotransferase MoeA, partial [Acidiplasma cupricumulans]